VQRNAAAAIQPGRIFPKQWFSFRGGIHSIYLHVARVETEIDRSASLTGFQGGTSGGLDAARRFNRTCGDPGGRNASQMKLPK
jgi:hypothetical protein